MDQNYTTNADLIRDVTANELVALIKETSDAVQVLLAENLALKAAVAQLEQGIPKAEMVLQRLRPNEVDCLDAPKDDEDAGSSDQP